MKTHCVHGHEYTPENTRLERKRKGYWQKKCRKCCEINKNRYRNKPEAIAKERAYNAKRHGKSVEDLRPYKPRTRIGNYDVR